MIRTFVSIGFIAVAMLGHAESLELRTAYRDADNHNPNSNGQLHTVYFVGVPTEPRDLGYDPSFGPDPDVKQDPTVVLMICITLLGDKPYIRAPELRILGGESLPLPIGYNYDTGRFPTLIKINEDTVRSESRFLNNDRSYATILSDYVYLTQRLETIDNTYIKVYWTSTVHYVFDTKGMVAELLARMKEFGEGY